MIQGIKKLQSHSTIDGSTPFVTVNSQLPIIDYTKLHVAKLAHHNNFNCGGLPILLPYLEKIIAMLSGYSQDRFIDEAEFCQQFHISRKTAARYRNNGLKYSMPSGKKIYYRISWIEKFMEQNSHAGF